MARETITISSVASPEPRIVTIDSDSNEFTLPYGLSSQHPIVPPSLNDLNFLPNPLNVLATMAVLQADDEYSPNQRTHPSHLQFRRPQWMWVPLKAERQRTQQQTTPHFLLTTSPDESIRIFFQVTHLTPMSQETYLSLRALHPHRRLHGDKKESWAWGCLFPKKGECRSTPARHAANSYQPKRHPDAQENFKHYTFN